jgi:MoxR-like ATPase
MSVLDEVVGEFAARKLAEMGTEEMRESISKKIFSELMEQYGEVRRTVKVTPDVGEPIHIDGVIHEMFETVLAFVRNNEPVYLAGEAGSGKSVICEQVAQAMGLDFYYSSSVTQEYKITGFTDANGHYNESPFYQAFTKGGVFMLDELDASIPEVLILLNGAIANQKFDFPAPIGNVPAHPNFRIV